MGNGLKPFYFHVVFIGCYWKVDEYKAIVEFWDRFKSGFRIIFMPNLKSNLFKLNNKAWSDELTIFGVSLDIEDLIEKVLDNLGDGYKELVRVVQARDSPITFEELYEKLLNFEAPLKLPKPKSSPFPATTNLTSHNI
jgi:hypothetical protein